MHQDQCLPIARDAAVNCSERHAYMPATALLAETWYPHRWVIDAMLLAAHEAEAERDSFKAGNTALLKALMYAHEDKDEANALRCAALREAGMLSDDGSCNWKALDARAPQQRAWADVVNECVTDPEQRKKLLAMD